MDLSSWTLLNLPERRVLLGSYARLEPLHAARHSADLFALGMAADAADRFQFLLDEAPRTENDASAWAAYAEASNDPLFFAVVDQATGRVHGRQALMRIDIASGVVEIGHVLWGPAIARSRVATEAFFLFADYVFSLGFRRLEWKCDNLNEASKSAAKRFGFEAEGLFRQHMVIRGRSRDTAWFAILDRDWPRLKAGYRRWLRPENFDGAARQLTRLNF